MQTYSQIFHECCIKLARMQPKDVCLPLLKRSVDTVFATFATTSQGEVHVVDDRGGAAY